MTNKNDTDTFHKLLDRYQILEPEITSIESKMTSMLKEHYKYSLKIHNRCQSRIKYDEILSEIKFRNVFGDYHFIIDDTCIYTKGFWLDIFNFDELKHGRLIFMPLNGGIIIEILVLKGIFEVNFIVSEDTIKNSFTPEQFIKFIKHENRDKLLQLMMNNESDLAFILLNNN